MERKLKSNDNKKQNLFAKRITQNILSVLFFCIPLFALYPIFNLYQSNLETSKTSEIFATLSELNAHLIRLTNYNSYYTNIISKLRAAGFPNKIPENIRREISSKALTLYLFDITGKRIAWKAGSRGKKRISEIYMKSILKLANNPETRLSQREISIASSFSGDSGTLFVLADKPRVWCNFQSSGLNRAGAWFKVALKDGKQAILLAWIDLTKVNIQRIAQSSVDIMTKSTDNKYQFAWIDLYNTASNGGSNSRHIRKELLKVLTQLQLCDKLVYKNTLFSISDTKEGIRLVCATKALPPPQVLKNYYSIIQIFLPTLLLFLLWKFCFDIRFRFNIKTIFISISLFLILILSVTLILEFFVFKAKENQTALLNSVQQASDILCKVDQSFLESNNDLEKQYKQFSNSISLSKIGSVTKILQPLVKAQKDGIIEFASYTDSKGKVIFKVPGEKVIGNSQSFSSRYDILISTISDQAINEFNYSKSKKKDVSGITAFSSRPIEGLLATRGTLHTIALSGEEAIAFIDIPTNESGRGKGFLFIAHNSSKLRMKYLKNASQNLKRATNFSLLAFPKNNNDRTSFFPDYSYFSIPSIWKTHDLVNQTQMFTWRLGLDSNHRKILITAVPGHNINSHNLFLLLPYTPITGKMLSVSRMLGIISILTIIVIFIFYYFLYKTVILPISRIGQIIQDQSYQTNNVFDFHFQTGSEIENIKDGIDLIIKKIQKFKEGQSLKSYLLPEAPLELDKWIVKGHRIKNGSLEREIYTYFKLPENKLLFSIFRDNNDKLTSGIHLSMIKMGLNIISQELHIDNPRICLKELDSFFRTTLRKHITSDIFVGVAKLDENTIDFSSIGTIPAYFVSNTGQVERIEIDNCHIKSNTQDSESISSIPFKPGSSIFISSPGIHALLNKNEISDLRENVQSIFNSVKKDDYTNELSNFLEDRLSSGMNESLCFLTIRHEKNYGN